MKIITIHTLLARINRKLAPNGKIHKSSPREVESGLGIWHVTESNRVVRTFDDIADFHHYAAELGVLGDVAHVNFPEGYFPEGSGFEDVASSLYADLGAEDDEDSLDLSYSSSDEEAVDETIVANRMFAAAFECRIYERLAPFQRRALEAAMNADDDGATHALAEIVHKHRRGAWLAMDGAFKVDADRSFNDAAQAAALEIKPAIGDDESNVVPFRPAKAD